MFGHPVWLVGFRPFFTLAFFFGAALPLFWAAVLAGWVTLPHAALAPVQWHAHEMLFGFGWAVLGGFLLTASKNWVSVRGLHGGPLALAVALWLVERGVVMTAAADALTAPLTLALLNAFGLYVIGYLVWTLVRYRKQDSYPDNWFFICALPLFLVAKNLMLVPESWNLGVSMSIGLFRVAFALMFERTMTPFMKNGMGVTLPRRRWLDTSIKSLVLLAAFEALLPVGVAVVVLSTAAALLLARFLTWKPLVGLRRLDIGVMYVGYLGLVIHLVLSAVRLSGHFVGLGALSIHAFTFLCIGLVVPAMLIRISQGHTGRKLLFTASDRAALWLMGLAALLRLVATQLWPARYADFVTAAALGWSACFLLIGVRLTPFLWQARVDGREH